MMDHDVLTRRHFLSAAAAAGMGFSLAGRGGAAEAAPWKAGIATVKITPDKPQWMGGYASRKKPSEGVLMDLYAKALALEDPAGSRAVLVTADLIGFPAVLSEKIAQFVQERQGVPRDRLLINASHTHSGPVMAHPLQITYKATMSEAQWRDVETYSRQVVDRVAGMVDDAFLDLQPARLSFGHGTAGFNVNRRQKKGRGYVIGVNPDGPVDRDVPVLRVDSELGSLRAVVFGYACHNTTLGGDNYQLCGDYAGFAQAALESRHPGAAAFFVTGCGADANPNPRGTVPLARKYGEELAGAVEKTLAGGSLAPVGGPLNTAFEVVPVAFAPPPSRETLEAGRNDKNAASRRHAEELLKILDRDGRLQSEYPYPLQVWQFGQDLTLIALAGEVVVDYSLRLKQELGADRLWVAGYSNDVFGYVPSLRVLQEGGYEGGEAMVGGRLPGPFAPTVEETIIGKGHDLVRRVRGQQPAASRE